MTARLAQLTRTTLVTLVACAALVGAGTAAVAATTASPARIQITGTVSDHGGYPLAGMRVQVVRADHEDSDFAATSTDWAGAFGSPRIPVDATTKYVLEVTDPTGRHQVTHSKPFAATGANRKQNVTMADAGVIRGKVSTKDGDDISPATHILVTANNSTSVATSTRGAFSLGGLPSGSYSLIFEDADEDGTRVGPLFRTICYDNVPLTAVEPDRCDGATLVKVTAGKVTTINPQVLDHRLGFLSGTVTGAGKPLDNVTVDAYAANDQSHYLGEDRTAGAGNWTINGVDFVGKIKLVARDDSGTYRTTWYQDAVDFAHATALQLNDQGEIDDILIGMPVK